MNRNLLFSFFASIAFCATPFAQNNDPIIFTVADAGVPASEFDYIYSKTGGEEADYSESSLREYLDLYVNFKLKVRKARDMQLDTIEALQRELAGYRKQLADSYLMDREVTDRLVREAYERKKEDVDISHILFIVPPNAASDAEAAALEKAREARRKILDGAAFEEVALAVSEDPSVKQNKGRIGFLTALFPNGFYALETAAYTQAEGEVGDPVRTRSGYHLLKVHGKRPAYGEVEVAHILIRKKKDGSGEEARNKIDSLYLQLEGGADFNQLAKTHSEDRRTAANGGYLGFFGIKKYELPFEEAAFGIKEDGAYSSPVETAAGWHIIKRISRKGIQPFPDSKRRLEAAIKRDARYAKAQDALVERILEEGNYLLNEEVLNDFTDSLSAGFFEANWKPDNQNSNEELFQLGGQSISLGVFQVWLQRSTRQRMNRKNRLSPSAAASDLFKPFLKESCLKYEEGRLEKKYPEFKALMREYEEGILLFEATRLKVWDKAARDTAGLEVFFQTIQGKYRWEERLRLTEFRFSKSSDEEIEAFRETVQKSAEEDILAGLENPEQKPDVDTILLERSRMGDIPGLKWKKGFVTEARSVEGGMKAFYRVEEILPPADKRLDEARGYIIADYQDHLEAQWIKELREEYPVNVNEDVLQSLIGKQKPAQQE